MALQHNKPSDRSLITRIKDIPEALLENRITAFAGLGAAAAGLLPDPFKAAYWIIFPVFILLCIFGTWYKLREKHKYLETMIAIPIAIRIANKADANDALKSLFQAIEVQNNLKNHAENLAKYLHIDLADLKFEYGSDNEDIFNTERLQRFLTVLKYGMTQLQRRAPKATFCIGCIGPTSVAIAIGTMLAHTRIMIFHFDSTLKQYIPIIETSRHLKENVAKFEKFEIKALNPAGDPLNLDFDGNISERNIAESVAGTNTGKVTLAIDVSAHKINIEDSSIRTWGDRIYMRSIGNGTIAQGEDWSQYCREIFKVLNTIQQQYSDPEIRLVYSMPVALGLALGIATQNYWNVMLTNYDKGTYRELLRLDKIELNY